MDVHVCVGVWLSTCACVGRCVRRGVVRMYRGVVVCQGEYFRKAIQMLTLINFR